MIQAVFFDLDGTLIDSRLDLTLAVNLTRREFGLPELPTAVVIGFVGNGLRRLAKRSLPELPEDEFEEALLLLRRRYAEHEVDSTTLYPGVKPGLAALADSGLSLAVITNKPEANAVSICRKLGIADDLREIVGADRAVALKPEPDALLLLAKSFKLELPRCWMVGDLHVDMEAAHRAKAVGVFAKWGFGKPDDDGKSCDLAFDSFGALAAAALTLRAKSPA